MKKLLIIIFISLFGVVSYAEENYTLEADKAIKLDNTTYMATGNVIVTYQDMVITADNVTFKKDEMRIIAKGNVLIVSPTQELQAEEIDYNMDAQTGTAKEIKGFLAPFHYLCASSMERTGATTFKVENARISTCSGDTPDWSISMYSGKLELEGYMQADHVTADIKNVPFIYFPKLFYPVTAKRETGLLMPNGGFSNTKGAFLSLGYFIAPDVNYDITLAVNLFTKAGVQPMAEVRYANSIDNNFYGAFEWINDVSSKSDQQSRYKYVLKNSYTPVTDLTLSVNANNVSDYLYSRDFYKFSISNYHRINKENMFFDEALANYTNPYADIRLAYRNDYMYRDLTQGYQLSRLEQMPSLTIEKIIPINNFLVMDYQAKYDYLYNGTNKTGLDGINIGNIGQQYHRVALDAKLFIPIDIAVAVLTPTIEFGYTYWNTAKNKLFNIKDEQSDVFGAVKRINDESFYRYHGTLSLVASFREIYKEFGSVTHAMVNTLTANYSPLINQTALPHAFTLDRINPAGGLTYKMINYLYGKKWSTTLTLTQSVDILAPDLVSPLLANMVTNVLGIVTNTFDLTYKHSGGLKPGESRMQYISDDLTLNITKYVYVFGTYTHDTRIQDSFNTAIRVGGGVRAFGITLSGYNKWQGLNDDGFSNLFVVGQGGAISYAAECWSLGFMLERNSYFSNYISGQVSRDEIVVSIAFTLRGLGEMKFQFTNTVDRPANL